MNGAGLNVWMVEGGVIVECKSEEGTGGGGVLILAREVMFDICCCMYSMRNTCRCSAGNVEASEFTNSNDMPRDEAAEAVDVEEATEVETDAEGYRCDVTPPCEVGSGKAVDDAGTDGLIDDADTAVALPMCMPADRASTVHLLCTFARPTGLAVIGVCVVIDVPSVVMLFASSPPITSYGEKADLTFAIELGSTSRADEAMEIAPCRSTRAE